MKDDNYKKKRNRIIRIIIIIIIILLLLTSCTATNFFGTIGKRIYESGSRIFNNNEGIEKIVNENLKFDIPGHNKKITITTDDDEYKLSFTAKGINPKKYTCTTSDSKIATCYVKNGYIVIKPKKKGTVTISVHSKINNKEYIAKTTIKIKGVNKKDTTSKENTDETNNEKNTSSDNNNNKRRNTKSNNTNNNSNNNSNSSNNNTNNDNSSNNNNNQNEDNKKDSTNTLRNISVDGYTLDQSFDENTLDYTLTIPNDVKSINVNVEKKSDKEKVEISGNTNLSVGENIVTITVTAEDGSKLTYKITVTREENIDNYKIDFVNDYTVGYRDNYNTKEIIITNNILEGNITSVTTNNKLIIKDDQDNRIELNSDDLELVYVSDNSKSSLVVKVTYNLDSEEEATKKITITGYRKNKEITKYNDTNNNTITFNIKRMYLVTLDANGGFFSKDLDKYDLTFYSGEELDLTEYLNAYKLADDNCTTYEVEGYSYDSDGNIIENNKIKITKDLTLYIIYKDTTKTYEEEKRLYLDTTGESKSIFTLLNSNEKIIYPGANNAYVMTVENDTDNDITLKKIVLEEENFCSDNNSCVNIGYIIKHAKKDASNYSYSLGNENNYEVLYTSANTKKKDDNKYSLEVNLNDEKGVKLEPHEVYEISLLWKWVDSDNDTEIGKLAANNSEDSLYKLRVSYIYTTIKKECEG